MINFYQGELKDILPVNLKTPETLSLSFAVGQAMRCLQDFSKRISMYADLSQVPEEVLDLMALELHTQYYDQTLRREIKEGLVTQTLVWYMHSGTPSVLQEFLATVLQGGELQEWYEYGGEPYYFKAVATMGEDDFVPVGYGAEIRRRIGIYKNIRSWLESLAFALNTSFKVSVLYDSRLLVRWEFYARNNRQFLYLDETWKLDYTYRLNGYRETEALDFYPVHLKMISDYQVPVLEEGQFSVKEESIEKIQVTAGLKVSGTTGHKAETSSRMETGCAVQAEMEVSAGLRVENNLWYLDDTYLLDGTRYLDAEIFEYEL